MKILLSLLLFSLFFFSPFAQYQEEEVKSGTQINPQTETGLVPMQLCNDSDINGPDEIVETVFGNVSFQAPSLNSDISFPSVASQARAFPFTLRISYQWFLEDNTTCMDFTYDHPVDASDDLVRWQYIASFVPNYCLPTMDNPGPSIRAVASFCSLDPGAYISFFASMDSVQSETMFKSNTEIDLPGPRAALTAQFGSGFGVGNNVKYGETFTFVLKGKKGTFTVTLDSQSATLNRYFTDLSVGHASYSENTVVSLATHTGNSYSYDVERVDGETTTYYFILVEANNLNYANLAGFVEFEQEYDDDDDFPLGWVIGGVVGGVLLIIAIIVVAFVVYKKFSSQPDYNEFE